MARRSSTQTGVVGHRLPAGPRGKDGEEPGAYRHPRRRRTPWDLEHRAQLVRAKVEILTAAGAVVVWEETYGEQLDHVVMLDLEGNEFCVA